MSVPTIFLTMLSSFLLLSKLSMWCICKDNILGVARKVIVDVLCIARKVHVNMDVCVFYVTFYEQKLTTCVIDVKNPYNIQMWLYRCHFVIIYRKYLKTALVLTLSCMFIVYIKSYVEIVIVKSHYLKPDCPIFINYNRSPVSLSVHWTIY